MPTGIYIRTEKAKENMSKAHLGQTGWSLGKKFSPEHVLKLREAHIGQKSWNKGKEIQTNTGRTHFKKGIIPWNKGKKLPQYSGSNACNWKGGITPIQNKIRGSIESKLWAQAVFARDGYVCQKTGLKGGKLTAHHILNFSSYPELRFAIDNGVTLSKEAHNEFHKIYGKKSNTREQLIDFLNNKHE